LAATAVAGSWATSWASVGRTIAPAPGKVVFTASSTVSFPVVSDAGSKPRTLCAVVVKLATVEMGLAVANFRHVHPSGFVSVFIIFSAFDALWVLTNHKAIGVKVTAVVGLAEHIPQLHFDFVSALVVRKLVREDDLVQFFFVLSFEEDVATPYGFACTVAQLFIRSTFKPKGFQTPVDLFASELTV